MLYRHADPKSSSEKLVFHKIHFTVRKRVKFGQAVYVCGSRPQIGLWHPEKAFRLKWNEGDTWTGTLLLTANIPPYIQFKYMISTWENPSSQRCQWEIGDHNRKADLNHSKSLTFIDDKWNIDQISLYLITKRPKTGQGERYYVTGNILQLGNWQDRRLMKKNLNSYIANHLNNKEWENIIQYSGKDNQLWTFSFEIFRLQTHFYYYYMRTSDFTETERKPGRIFQFNQQQTHYPSRRNVLHPRGDIVIIDQSSIDQIKLSKITSRIYVGNYVKTIADLQKLKRHNINTILSIQSQRDYKKNGVSSYYLDSICRENNIELKTCSIQDMNKKDFITHAQEGVKIMDEVLARGGKIYVHCTAGIYRSPQMIALYLVAIQKYKIEDAVALLKERHSYAKPSFKTIQEALNLMQRKNKELLRV